MKDYYQILEVAIEASQDTIKEQYRFLAQAWHPDKFPNPAQKLKAEEKLKEINAAYEILRNPAKRAEYDSRFRYAYPNREQAHHAQRNQRQSEDDRRKKEESERRAREEQLRKERAEREREEAERKRSENERQQKVKLDNERLEIEKYGIEVVTCPLCGTINSLSFTQCRKCRKDIMKVQPVKNPYLFKVNEKGQRTQTGSSHQKHDQKQNERFESAKQRTDHQQQQKRQANSENPEMEKRRVEKYGIEIIICSSCGTKNSLSFSHCINCSKDMSREKIIPNPYL